MAVPVVHDGPDELVVVKPAGLPCELPRDPAADSLLARLAAGGHTGLRLVHRLDTPACGLVLVARSRESAARHAADIAARRWRKWYVARVAAPLDEVQRLLGRHRAYLKVDGRQARVVRAGGKPSSLDLVRAAGVPGADALTDVLVALHTGRYHQIRVMLAHLGAPLAGDARYGGPSAPWLYLEHVVLATPTESPESWRVWEAPAHRDRPAWDAAMADAVTTVAATARTAPPPPAPDR
ncbi:MAG: pseudouridine synthase family protein [Vicinamibacterales bacterium]